MRWRQSRWTVSGFKALAALVGEFALLSIAFAGVPDVAAFYTGKTITLGVPGGAGGGYDVYARTLAQFFPQFIPGHPTVVVQYLPGAGGLVAANQIYNVANRDGTALTLLQSSSFLVRVLGDPNAKFDNSKFTPIGNVNQEVDTCSVWHTTGIKDAEAFLHDHVILGVTGPGSNGQTFPLGMMDALGANFKLIAGYSEGPARVLAMERGELQATCGIFVSTLHAKFAKPVAEGKMRVVLQMALERHPSLEQVPNALELAHDSGGRQELALLFSQLSLGRPVVGPPGIPPERAAALSTAFEQTMKDPRFEQLAAQRKLETRWLEKARMRKIVADMDSAPDSIKARLRKALQMK